MKIPSLFNNHLMKALLLGVLNYKKPLDYSRGHLNSMPDNEDAMCLERHYSDFRRKKLRMSYTNQIFEINESIKEFIQKTSTHLYINNEWCDNWKEMLTLLNIKDYNDAQNALMTRFSMLRSQAIALIHLFEEFKRLNYNPRNHSNHHTYFHCNYDWFYPFKFEGGKLWHVEEVKDQPLLEEVEYDWFYPFNFGTLKK